MLHSITPQNTVLSPVSFAFCPDTQILYKKNAVYLISPTQQNQKVPTTNPKCLLEDDKVCMFTDRKAIFFFLLGGVALLLCR